MFETYLVRPRFSLGAVLQDTERIGVPCRGVPIRFFSTLLHSYHTFHSYHSFHSFHSSTPAINSYVKIIHRKKGVSDGAFWSEKERISARLFFCVFCANLRDPHVKIFHKRLFICSAIISAIRRAPVSVGWMPSRCISFTSVSLCPVQNFVCRSMTCSPSRAATR